MGSVTREHQIVQAFVDFAGTLANGFDVMEFLHRLTRASEDLLECSEVGLLLADASGSLRVMASSSERSEALDLLQTQHSEGPCFECLGGGKPVLSPDLEADLARWPVFAPAAVGMGFRSVHAVPMRVTGEVVGAVNLFRSHPGRLPGPDVELAQGLADVAAIALMQERVARESRETIEQLQGALVTRVVIEQAKGMLAAGACIGIDEAFTRMRDYARSGNLRLSDVARDLVDGRLEVGSVVTSLPR